MANRESEFDNVAEKLNVVNTQFRVGRLTGFDDYEDAEEAVRFYFENLDYNVHKMRGANASTKSYLQSTYKFFKGLEIGEPGMPDFFVDKLYYQIKPNKNQRSKTINDDTVKGDYRFVEVKKTNGGLKMNQLKWIGKHPHIPIEVIIVE